MAFFYIVQKRYCAEVSALRLVDRTVVGVFGYVGGGVIPDFQ